MFDRTHVSIHPFNECFEAQAKFLARDFNLVVMDFTSVPTLSKLHTVKLVPDRLDKFGSLIIIFNNDYQEVIENEVKDETELHLKNRICYELPRVAVTPSPTYFHQRGEILWYAKHKSCYTFNKLAKSTDLWKGIRSHLYLLRNIVRIHSNIQDKVLDCFAGRGDLMKACKRFKRNYVGYEPRKNFYDHVVGRL